MNGHHVFSECAILVVYSFKGISGVLEINKKYALRYLSLLQYVWTCPAIHEITLCSRRHPCCLSRIWPLGVTAAAALATAATASNINETDLSVPCSRRCRPGMLLNQLPYLRFKKIFQKIRETFCCQRTKKPHADRLSSEHSYSV